MLSEKKKKKNQLSAQQGVEHVLLNMSPAALASARNCSSWPWA